MAKEHQTAETRITDWTKNNFSWLLSIILTIAVLAVGYKFYQARKQKRATQAWTQLVEMMGTGDEAGLKKLEKEYLDTSAGPWILLAQAGYLQGQRRWDEAKNKYQELIKKYPDFEMILSAKIGVGQCLTAEKDLTAARRHFENLLDTTTDKWYRSDIQLQLTLIDEKEDQKREAVEGYKKLLRTDDSFFKKCAEIRLVLLGVLKKAEDLKKILALEG